MKDERLTLENRRTALVHYNASFIGGAIGVYPILCFAGVFGSAQTTNWISSVVSLLGGDYIAALLHLLGAVLYMSAVCLVTVLVKRIERKNVQFLSLGVDAVCALVLFFIPDSLSPIVLLYPTFFAMSFQWCSFPGAYGYISSTIFATNNTRQMVSALSEVWFNHDNSFRLKAVFYAVTLGCFLLGVAYTASLWLAFDRAAALFALLPIGVGVLNLTIKCKKEKVNGDPSR